MIFTFLALIIIFLILFLIIKKYKETFVIEKDIDMEDNEQISTKFNELIDQINKNEKDIKDLARLSALRRDHALNTIKTHNHNEDYAKKTDLDTYLTKNDHYDSASVDFVGHTDIWDRLLGFQQNWHKYAKIHNSDLSTSDHKLNSPSSHDDLIKIYSKKAHSHKLKSEVKNRLTELENNDHNDHSNIITQAVNAAEKTINELDLDNKYTTIKKHNEHLHDDLYLTEESANNTYATIDSLNAKAEQSILDEYTKTSDLDIYAKATTVKDFKDEYDTFKKEFGSNIRFTDNMIECEGLPDDWSYDNCPDSIKVLFPTPE
jgi:hypothetical protein